MTEVTGFIAVAIVVGLVGAGYCSGPVQRSRVEKFAIRQRLPITVDNAPLVIRYLATTRRWRVTGLLASAVLYPTLMPGTSGSWPTLLSGWFAGAIVAEWRQARPPADRQRSALLVPRDIRDYLPVYWRFAPWAALVVALVPITAAAMSERSVRDVAAAPVLAAALLGIVWLVERRVLQRAQPLGGADVIAADDAIRSRSLHVLVGSATTLALYVSSTQLAALQRNGWAAALGIGAPAVGIMIATDRWRVRRPAMWVAAQDAP